MPSNWIDVRTHGPDEEEGYPAVSPPEDSNYRPQQEDAAQSCGMCLYRIGDVCQLWNAIVNRDWTCDEFEVPEQDDDAISMSEETPAVAYLHGRDAATSEEGDLIWKEIAREGELAMYPGAGQKAVRKPLRIKLKADKPTEEIGLQDLCEAFNDRAVDHVTVPLTHADRVEDNTGYVERLRIEEVPGQPGRHRLMAGHRFTEPEIREKVKRGSIANTSVGILFNYVRKGDGKLYRQVLAHNALTNKPWFTGLTPFGVNAADVLHFAEPSLIDEVIEEELALGSGAPLPGGKPGDDDNWVDRAGGLPRYVREVARELMKNGHPKSRAIAIAISRIKKWAVTSKDPKVKAKAAKAIAEWESKKARAKLDAGLPADLSGLSLSEARELRLGRFAEWKRKRDWRGRFATNPMSGWRSDKDGVLFSASDSGVEAVMNFTDEHGHAHQITTLIHETGKVSKLELAGDGARNPELAAALQKAHDSIVRRPPRLRILRTTDFPPTEANIEMVKRVLLRAYKEWHKTHREAQEKERRGMRTSTGYLPLSEMTLEEARAARREIFLGRFGPDRWDESKIRRGFGGRFMDKPDVPKMPRPEPARPPMMPVIDDAGAVGRYNRAKRMNDRTMRDLEDFGIKVGSQVKVSKPSSHSGATSPYSGEVTAIERDDEWGNLGIDVYVRVPDTTPGQVPVEFIANPDELDGFSQFRTDRKNSRRKLISDKSFRFQQHVKYQGDDGKDRLGIIKQIDDDGFLEITDIQSGGMVSIDPSLVENSPSVVDEFIAGQKARGETRREDIKRLATDPNPGEGYGYSPKLKMSRERYVEIAQKVKALDTPELRQKYLDRDIPRADSVKDIDKRYRWDLANSVVRLWTLYDEGLTDAQIDSALKHMIPSLQGGPASKQAKARKGVNMSETRTNDESVELQLAEAQREIAELRRDVQIRKVDDKIASYQEQFGNAPALLSTLRDLMLADDGGPVVAINLSDDGSNGERTLTVTEVIDIIMDKMPKSSVQLSEQHSRMSEGSRPPVDTSDERPVTDRAREAAEFLGDKVYLKKQPS